VILDVFSRYVTGWMVAMRKLQKPPTVPTEVWINKPLNSNENTH